MLLLEPRRMRFPELVLVFKRLETDTVRIRLVVPVASLAVSGLANVVRSRVGGLCQRGEGLSQDEGRGEVRWR